MESDRPPGSRSATAFIATAFAQVSAPAASTQWREVAVQLRPKLAELSAFMDEAENDALAYMAFPAKHWPKFHPTNGRERRNGEIKRRTEVVGIFPNDAAIVRLVGAFLLEQNHKRAVQRGRYMTPETVAAEPSATPRLEAPSVCRPQAGLSASNGRIPKL